MPCTVLGQFGIYRTEFTGIGNGLAMSNEKKFHERIMGPWRLGGEMDFWVVLEETVES